jgi:hypothetical protein
MVPKHHRRQGWDAKSLGFIELAASNWFQRRQRIGSSHIYPFQAPSVPVATWRDLGALLALDAFGRNGSGSLFNESTAERRFCGIA